MSVTIELSGELEAGLAAVAAAQGLTVPDYVRNLLSEQVLPRVNSSSAQRIALWRDVGSLPQTPFLSDAAISREMMYGQRG